MAHSMGDIIPAELVSAVRDRDFEKARRLVGSLIRQDPDRKAPSHSYNSAQTAVESEMAKFLIASGFHVNPRYKVSDNTLLYFPNKEFVEIQRENANAMNIDGKIPLHSVNRNILMATNDKNGKLLDKQKLITLVEDLMKFSAIIPEDKSNDKTLQLMPGNQEIFMAQLLISYGANVYACDNEVIIVRAVSCGKLNILNLTLINDTFNLNLLKVAKEKNLLQYDSHRMAEQYKDKPQSSNYCSTEKQKIETFNLSLVINDYLEIFRIISQCNAIYKQLGYLQTKTTMKIVLLEGNITIGKTLLESVAQVDSETIYGVTALCMPVELTNKEYGSDFNTTKNNMEKTLIHIAPEKVYLSEVKPLHFAALEENVQLVKALLESGAEVDSETIYGVTALHIAAQLGNYEIMELLLLQNADVNARDFIDKTPLHVAADEGRLEPVKLLMRFGADALLQSKENRTALNYSEEYKYYYKAPNGFPEGNCYCHRWYEYNNAYEPLLYYLQGFMCTKLGMFIERSRIHEAFNGHHWSELKNAYRDIFEKINVPYNDILSYEYAKNNNIFLIIQSKEFQNKYPTDAICFENEIRQGIERKRLMGDALQEFYTLSDNLPYLPEECVENIFSFMRNADLRLLGKKKKAEKFRSHAPV